MTTGELTLGAAARRAILKPSINWLLAFIPVTLALEGAHAAPPLIFFSAALAIVPIAALIVHSTEQISTRTGDAVGGLLNATFGNAPELIIATVALKAGLVELVRASIIGAILGNLLLAARRAPDGPGVLPLRHDRGQPRRGAALRRWAGVLQLAQPRRVVGGARVRRPGRQRDAVDLRGVLDDARDLDLPKRDRVS